MLVLIASSASWNYVAAKRAGAPSGQRSCVQITTLAMAETISSIVELPDFIEQSLAACAASKAPGFLIL